MTNINKYSFVLRWGETSKLLDVIFFFFNQHVCHLVRHNRFNKGFASSFQNQTPPKSKTGFFLQMSAASTFAKCKYGFGGWGLVSSGATWCALRNSSIWHCFTETSLHIAPDGKEDESLRITLNSVCSLCVVKQTVRHHKRWQMTSVVSAVCLQRHVCACVCVCKHMRDRRTVPSRHVSMHARTCLHIESAACRSTFYQVLPQTWHKD